MADEVQIMTLESIQQKFNEAVEELRATSAAYDKLLGVKDRYVRMMDGLDYMARRYYGFNAGNAEHVSTPCHEDANPDHPEALLTFAALRSEILRLQKLEHTVHDAQAGSRDCIKDYMRRVGSLRDLAAGYHAQVIPYDEELRATLTRLGFDAREV